MSIDSGDRLDDLCVVANALEDFDEEEKNAPARPPGRCPFGFGRGSGDDSDKSTEIQEDAPSRAGAKKKVPTPKAGKTASKAGYLDVSV